MSMSQHGLHLSKPLAETAAVAAWPAVGSRALTREERAWLEAVPGDGDGMVRVEFAGVVTGWVRGLFCGFIEEAVRRGRCRLSRDGSALVAVVEPGGRRHVVDQGQGAGVVASEGAPPAEEARRRFVFSRRQWRPWIEHAQPQEVTP